MLGDTMRRLWNYDLPVPYAMLSCSGCGNLDTCDCCDACGAPPLKCECGDLPEDDRNDLR